MGKRILPILLCLAGVAGADTLADYREARDVVQRALAAAGGPDWLDQTEGLVLEGRGTWDLATRMQGRTWDSPEPQPLEELLVIAPDGTLVHESSTRINPDAAEHVRYQYAPDAPLLFVDRLNQRAFWDEDTDAAADRARYRRTLPPLLLAEALDQPDSLRYLGEADGEHRVLYAPGDIAPLTLAIADGSWRLTGVDYLIDIPHLGDTVVRWSWKPPGEHGLPLGYTIHLGDRLLREVDYTTIRTGAEAVAQAVALPANIAVPEPPEPTPATQGGSSPPRPRFRELAPGVYLVPNIRSGFHHLIVEFADHLAVIDAPTGWYELQQLPAKNWAGEVTSSSAAQKLIDIAGEAAPGKPIRYLVLTHHHSDHAGGVRPFLALGSTVVAAPETLGLIERTAKTTFTLVNDGLGGRTFEVKTLPVTDRTVLEDDNRRLELINVGENPHVDGMLVAWLPEPGLLYQADLFEPIPERFFPSSERVPVMRWFVGWLDRSGLEPAEIRAIHGTSKVTPEQLAIIRGMQP